MYHMPAMNPNTIYPLEAARTVALHAQHLTTPNGAEPTPTLEAIYATVEQMGCVQIDTLQMVQRSQYLALWSRLGNYDPADLDRVAFGDANGNPRRLFEYWLHAACLIPLAEYRYRKLTMQHHKERGDWWGGEWFQQEETQALMKAVLNRIRKEGALRSSDFEHIEKRQGSWWNWKPAKRVLEHHFNTGRLMISGRTNFQRIYDLNERVLTDWVDKSTPTPEETDRHLLERSLKAFGICDAGHAGSMVHGFKRAAVRAALKQLLDEGTAVEVQVQQNDGQPATMVLHRDHLPTLLQAADGALQAERTTFLSPFDNLWWAYRRDVALWGFRQSLEAYTPAEKRVYGYFSLPILHRGRLVGRFDPKLERQTGTLRLRALHLEPKVKVDEQLVSDVATALRDFMRFHQATDVVIEKSEPATFAKKLMKAL